MGYCLIIITDKKQCSGCGACIQICPKRCIVMQADAEGFDYPVADLSACTNCNLCNKICPVQTSRCGNNDVLSTYAAYARQDEVRMQSSSGGLFTLLADKILEQNGVIFGAAFDNSFLVHHIAVQNKDELEDLRGSKYLQSRAENTFDETKHFLDTGHTVLYTGTACQIAGLKAFLQKEYENLYTADVLCHGVPSPTVWKQYLYEQSKTYGGDIKRTLFRQKCSGWKTYSVELHFSNSTEYRQVFSKDWFMKLFLQNICLRPSCYDCKFKELHRPSDITIGDCWGIDQYMPGMDDDKGTSVVLVHSAKGQVLFDAISSKIVYRKAETDELLPPTADSRKSVPMHPRRKAFFKKLANGVSIEKLVKLTEPTIRKNIERKIKALIKRYVYSFTSLDVNQLYKKRTKNQK